MIKLCPPVCIAKVVNGQCLVVNAIGHCININNQQRRVRNLEKFNYQTNFKKRNLFWRSSVNPCYNCPDSQRWFCNLHPEVRAECATLSGKDIKGDSRV